MHIGMIVGIGPAAADYYYRAILAIAGHRAHELDLTMAHTDLETLRVNLTAGDTEAQAAVYLRLTERLEAAGAQAVAITSIGGHFCIDAFKAVSSLPVINILDEVDAAAKAAGHRRLGLIGNGTPMRTRFYGALTATEVLVPQGDMLEQVHTAYMAMATRGAVTAAERDCFFRAGRDMMAAGAEAIMLGGTDLGLAFDGVDAGFPVFDCAGVHAAAIARAALG